MKYRKYSQIILETEELIELAKEHGLLEDLEKLQAKKEFYIKKLAELV